VSGSHSLPVNVEIAGVAGTGKSTLAGLLCSERGFGRLDDTLRFREPSHLRYVFRSLPRLTGLAKRWLATRRTPSWTELKLVIYLMEWDSHLVRSRHSDKATILDQGPVYALARLGYVDPLIAGTEPHGDWWHTMVDTWAGCLDAIVWLDAPNPVLASRIDNRSQDHQIKGKSPLEAAAFADRYRASYEEVIAAMDRTGGPVILRYDTSRMSAADIAADTIRQIVHLQPGSRRPTSEGGLS
jgi:cytidylate kinase